VIKKRLPLLVKKLSAFPEVAAVYLFGSFAREEPRTLSDVDIAVFSSPGSSPRRKGYRRLAYIDAVTKALGVDRLDLVILNEVPVPFRHEVFRDGKLLYVRDRVALARFRESSMREYLDTLPLRRIYREAYFNRIRENGFGRQSSSR
jgi:predicted nucleotidyltransferase